MSFLSDAFTEARRIGPPLTVVNAVIAVADARKTPMGIDQRLLNTQRSKLVMLVHVVA